MKLVFLCNSTLHSLVSHISHIYHIYTYIHMYRIHTPIFILYIYSFIYFVNVLTNAHFTLVLQMNLGPPFLEIISLNAALRKFSEVFPVEKAGAEAVPAAAAAAAEGGGAVESGKKRTAAQLLADARRKAHGYAHFVQFVLLCFVLFCCAFPCEIFSCMAIFSNPKGSLILWSDSSSLNFVRCACLGTWTAMYERLDVPAKKKEV